MPGGRDQTGTTKTLSAVAHVENVKRSIRQILNKGARLLVIIKTSSSTLPGLDMVTNVYHEGGMSHRDEKQYVTPAKKFSLQSSNDGPVLPHQPIRNQQDLPS